MHARWPGVSPRSPDLHFSQGGGQRAAAAASSATAKQTPRVRLRGWMRIQSSLPRVSRLKQQTMQILPTVKFTPSLSSARAQETTESPDEKP